MLTKVTVDNLEIKPKSGTFFFATMANKQALFTAGRKLNGTSIYLLSVFDMEPSGVIIHAYNQIDSKEYLLPISEMEVRYYGQ